MTAFKVTFTVTATIELNPEVLAQADDEWKRSFYDIDTPEDVAEMIAYNMIKGKSLSCMDGFANLPDEYAKFKKYPDYEVESSEKEIEGESNK
jgi:hypothetical protein